ncbi:hypothetical protein GL50803_0014284 [Giardia duodenalis]|uniref:Uncharacterized protein n=1 Tax=Giardia intestinalis (strain ATCC 50803 / WB clone C6) TaxID=184922 RepID=A8BE39_GIAIC|nr:Hypothetical protein with antisense transcription [Giardia intestinalis]KAE8305844.1 hypothetical protein GL50803_0014284 [Giardia intestinalis]|eukprot:XP_001707582.1 Hypothetical protein with antisense transcription [Giardia lamblia ATCC 50803]
MNTLLSYVVAVADEYYLFEVNSKASNVQKDTERQYKRPALFNTISHGSHVSNKCYEGLYILLNYLHHIVNFLIFLILVQYLGIQMVNIFGILYCFQEIVILAPVYAMSRVAHVSLTQLVQQDKALSFVAYAWAYILLSLFMTLSVAFLCTLLQNTLITRLLGDLAPWCMRAYTVSTWINATIVTISTCMQHILMAEERSVILLGALAAREFTKLLVFMVSIFYLSMPMVRKASYWTGEFNESVKLPTSEFYHEGMLYSTKPHSVSTATTIQELISLLSPHNIPQVSKESSKSLVMRVHLYSYHLSILLSSCMFIVIAACLVACRTREMGWANHKRDPIAVSCIPFAYGLLVLLTDKRGLAEIVKHFLVSWIPVYLDRISILVPLLTMCVFSRLQIMATERSTLKIMQLTLFRFLYDTFNSLSISIVDLFTAAIVRAHAERAYKKEVLIKRHVVFLCIACSAVSYPVMAKLNGLVPIFKQFNYKWLTQIEKLWIDSIYNDSGTSIVRYVSNLFIGAHILLVTHLLMDQKTISIYLLSLGRFFFCSMLTFSASRSPRFKFSLIQELGVYNVITSLISVLGLVLSSSKYNIS